MVSRSAVAALARATFRDTVRRPGFAVGCAALGVLLALIPHVGNPAAGVRDNAALALELSLATLALAAPLVAGLLCVRSMQPDDGAGLSMELVSAPRSVTSLVIGRWVGACVCVATLCVAAAVVGLAGWITQPSPPDAATGTAWVCLIAGGAAAAALGGALGMGYASLLPRDLAALVLVVHLVAVRWIARAAPGDPTGWLSAVVPDPARLDVARDVAFGGPVSAASTAAGIAAAVVQAAALIAFAVAAMRRSDAM